jgi:Penicillin binding protein transpeptidase domain
MTKSSNTPVTPRTAIVFLLIAVLLSCSSVFGKAKRNSGSKRASERSGRTDKRTSKKQKQTAASRRDRRGSKGRATVAESRRRGRPMSRRERALEAARIRRERIEAARRAEIARQQAIARQRAADQALRDETAANILKDDATGEDPQVRKLAIEALGNHAGSVVVMEPKTGKVLSVVNQEWALREGYKPCSTIKLVTGLAGLGEKVIEPNQTVNVTAANYAIDLPDSLAYSNNGFFQSVGGQLGFDRMISYARKLGLGEKTGINHSNEFAGKVPAFKSGYAVNHMSSHGDDFEVTPIQLGVLVSAIANGGSLVVPRLPKTPEDRSSFKKEVRREVDLPKEALQRMVPGMIGAVNYGTARLAYDPMQTIAGKTGTCIGQGGWLGLFASYAPVANPQLAVVVVTRGSGERGKSAAAIAGKIYRGLDARYGRVPGGQYAVSPVPQPRVSPKDAAAISDEEDEGDSMEDASNVRSGEAPSTSNQNVKRVIMPVGKRGNGTKVSPVSTPALQESTPDDIRIIDEANPAGSEKTDVPAEQRPRRVTKP